MTTSPSPSPSIESQPVGGWEGFWTWAQSPLGATIVGTLIASLILWIASLIYKRVTKASFWPVFGSWALSLLKWPLTLRVKTKRQLQTLDAGGYARRDREVTEEREHTPRPTWLIDQRGSMADDHVFILRNAGYSVDDVAVEIDDGGLKLRRPVFWRGSFGDSMPGSVPGRDFEGDLTEKGRTDGVTFKISYTDQAGDTQVEEYFLSPDRLMANELETREQAYARGRADVQSELDAQRTRPMVRAQWLIGKAKGKDGVFLILNTADGAVARDVSLSAPTSTFTFIGAPQWEDVSGEGQRVFGGRISEHGRVFGVEINVEWTDGNGERVALDVPLQGATSVF